MYNSNFLKEAEECFNPQAEMGEKNDLPEK